MQGHIVHVVGLGEAWVRELPGLVVAGAARDAVRGGEEGRGEKEEKMKIAWRYERLGEFGKERGALGFLFSDAEIDVDRNNEKKLVSHITIVPKIMTD